MPIIIKELIKYRFNFDASDSHSYSFILSSLWFWCAMSRDNSSTMNNSLSVLRGLIWYNSCPQIQTHQGFDIVLYTFISLTTMSYEAISTFNVFEFGGRDCTEANAFAYKYVDLCWGAVPGHGGGLTLDDAYRVGPISRAVLPGRLLRLLWPAARTVLADSFGRPWAAPPVLL
jgi:hypothetical protein